MAAEMLREADGWRDDEPPASPDVFVSLAGGWPRRGEAFFPPFFFFFFLAEGRVSGIHSSPSLPPLTAPLLHSQIQPDRVLPAGLLGAGKPEPRCEVTVAASPKERPQVFLSRPPRTIGEDETRTRASCGP